MVKHDQSTADNGFVATLIEVIWGIRIESALKSNACNYALEIHGICHSGFVNTLHLFGIGWVLADLKGIPAE